MKRILTVFVAGVMAFMTTSFGQVENQGLQDQPLKKFKDCINYVYSAILVQGENTVIGIKYWLSDYDLLWGQKCNIAINLNDKMVPGINQSQTICQNSGILIEVDKKIVDTILNNKIHRESG